MLKSLSKSILSYFDCQNCLSPEGRVGDGLIQIGDDKVTGLRLEPEFSGTAIWNEKLKAVVGMAVKQDKERPEAKVAFMIPTELLLNAWNGISEFCYVDRKLSELIALLESYFRDQNNQINRKLLNQIYQKSLPEIAIRDCLDDIDQIVKKLTSYTQRKTDEYLALDKFVGYLYLEVQKK